MILDGDVTYLVLAGKGFEDNHTRYHSKTGPNRGTVLLYCLTAVL